MHLKSILLLAVFNILLFIQFAQAQPQPCGDNPQMTSFCDQACVICDIDGFTGVNDLEAQGQILPGFCTTQYNNMQYIAFVAATENITIRVDVGNCVTGGWNSLELGFFQSFDCQNFTAITDCDTDIVQFTSQEFTNFSPLTVGQYYYMVIDGSGGANCEWTFTVVNGSTELAPLDTTNPIDGPEMACPGVMQSYFSEIPVGATLFEWTLNGAPVGDIFSNELDLSFDNIGAYTLCVQAKNVCDEAIPTCKVIQVENLDQTIIFDEFCQGDCYIIAGDTICESGTYSFPLTSQLGCDSMVFAELIELPQPLNQIDINICQGDTILINELPFTSSGFFEETVLTENNCDSIIQLDLFVVECNIESQNQTLDAICFGTASGEINFSIDNGTPPFNYQLSNLSTGFETNGMIANINELITINDLPIGQYIINIEDNFGNFEVIITNIEQPTLLTATLQAQSYNGFGVSCYNGSDGVLVAMAEGGIDPYTFLWSTGAATQSIENLNAGDYDVTVTDNVGCSQIQSFSITNAQAISLNTSSNNPLCDDFESGIIQVDISSGGASPFQYAINTGPFQSENVFDNLSANDYTILIQDDNGCSSDTTLTLANPAIPEFNLGDDITVNLGEEVSFDVIVNNAEAETIIWQSPDSLSCSDCLNPIFTPLNTADHCLTVISQDGCETTSCVRISVDKKRFFFAPNIFSPNETGLNNLFFISGGPEVQSIDLSIYDRWGNVVFNANNMDAQDQARAWTGEFNRQEVNNGVYAWIADIYFIDGFIEKHAGTITLIR